VARVGRAQALAALGRATEARADYEAALERNPALAPALVNLAVLLYWAGDVAGALARLDQAVALDASNPALYRNRAVALEELGRSDEAADDLARVLELAPDAADRPALEDRIAALRGALVAA